MTVAIDSCAMSFGIARFRKLALLVFMPLLVLVGASCSSFNREWRRVEKDPVLLTDLEGRWEGRWISDVNGHHGKLRCIIKRNGDVYSARFHAKYQKILTFGYTVALNSEKTESGFKFSGEANLGALAGGVYHYEGHADGTNFLSTYSCKYDQGKFEMQRR